MAKLLALFYIFAPVIFFALIKFYWAPDYNFTENLKAYEKLLWIFAYIYFLVIGILMLLHSALSLKIASILNIVLPASWGILLFNYLAQNLGEDSLVFLIITFAITGLPSIFLVAGIMQLVLRNEVNKTKTEAKII